MKKSCLFLILMFVTAIVCAQTKYYRTTEFRLRCNDKWSNWEPSKIPVAINYDDKRVEVETDPEQIIDYGKLKKKEFSTYRVYSGSATDASYQLINVYFSVYNNGSFIMTIEYADIQYAYKLEEVSLE